MTWFSRKKSAAPESASTARPDLVVPMVSGQAWMDANAKIFAEIPGFPAGERPHAIPLAEGLYLTYAIDPGPSWEVIGVDAAAAYGDADALRATALGNLRGRGDIRLQGGDGRFQLTVPDEMDLGGSVVLDPDRWRAAIPLDGDLVVAIPTRIGVYVCGADDAASIADLRALAPQLFDQADGKPVSPDLYRLTAAGLARLE